MVTSDDLWDEYRREKDPDVRERLLMIIWLNEEISSYEIGKRLNCPHSKVMYWKSRFAEDGINGLQTQPRSGKPSKLMEDQKDEIKKMLNESDSWQSKEVLTMIYDYTGVKYSKRQVTRFLHQFGYERIRPRKKHVLSDENLQKEFEKKTKYCWRLTKTGQ